MRFPRAAASCALLAALTAAACGSSSASPDTAVRQAVGGIGELSRARYSLTMQSDAKALTSWNDKLPEEEMATAEDLEAMLAVLDSALHVVWDRGADLAGLDDDSVGLAVDVDGIDNAVEARFLDGTVYARALARQLADRFGGDAGVLDDVEAQASGLGLDFVAAAFDGGWLSLELDPVLSFFKGIGGAEMFDEGFREEAGFGVSDLDWESLDKFLHALDRVYSEDVTVTEGDEEGPGRHYRLAASARAVYQRILPAVKDLPFFMGTAAEDFLAPGEVPDEDYTLDVWVDGGKLSRAEFDFSQVVPEGSDLEGMPYLALRVDIDHSVGAVAAPKDVTEVDLLELFGKMAGLAEGGES